MMAPVVPRLDLVVGIEIETDLLQRGTIVHVHKDVATVELSSGEIVLKRAWELRPWTLLGAS